MTILKQIEKEKQNLARCEKSLALDKLKKRKADTRRKIELGGLVIKAGMAEYNGAIILGALVYGKHQMQKDSAQMSIYENLGHNIFFKQQDDFNR